MPNYKDKYSTTCEQTKKWGNCKGGKPGKISGARLQKDANSNGISVLDACCVCGGGQGYLKDISGNYFIIYKDVMKS